jgi:hypothetical protein
VYECLSLCTRFARFPPCQLCRGFALEIFRLHNLIIMKHTESTGISRPRLLAMAGVSAGAALLA